MRHLQSGKCSEDGRSPGSPPRRAASRSRSTTTLRISAGSTNSRTGRAIGSGTIPTNYTNPNLAFGNPTVAGLGYFSVTPPTGRVGTIGRNDFYGPALINYDMSAVKSFRLWNEASNLQFRA